MGRGRLRPVGLQVFASALAGDVLASPGQACGIFGITWPVDIQDDRDRLRLEAGALALIVHEKSGTSPEAMCRAA
jgi:hypothetical protein